MGKPLSCCEVPSFPSSSSSPSLLDDVNWTAYTRTLRDKFIQRFNNGNTKWTYTRILDHWGDYDLRTDTTNFDKVIEGEDFADPASIAVLCSAIGADLRFGTNYTERAQATITLSDKVLFDELLWGILAAECVRCRREDPTATRLTAFLNSELWKYVGMIKNVPHDNEDHVVNEEEEQKPTSDDAKRTIIECLLSLKDTIVVAPPVLTDREKDGEVEEAEMEERSSHGATSACSRQLRHTRPLQLVSGLDLRVVKTATLRGFQILEASLSSSLLFPHLLHERGGEAKPMGASDGWVNMSKKEEQEDETTIFFFFVLIIRLAAMNLPDSSHAGSLTSKYRSAIASLCASLSPPSKPLMVIPILPPSSNNTKEVNTNQKEEQEVRRHNPRSLAFLAPVPVPLTLLTLSIRTTFQFCDDPLSDLALRQFGFRRCMAILPLTADATATSPPTSGTRGPMIESQLRQQWVQWLRVKKEQTETALRLHRQSEWSKLDRRSRRQYEYLRHYASVDRYFLRVSLILASAPGGNGTLKAMTFDVRDRVMSFVYGDFSLPKRFLRKKFKFPGATSQEERQ